MRADQYAPRSEETMFRETPHDTEVAGQQRSASKGYCRTDQRHERFVPGFPGFRHQCPHRLRIGPDVELAQVATEIGELEIPVLPSLDCLLRE